VGDAIRGLFATNDFAALEELATAWRQNKDKFLDGGWKLHLFYDALTPRRADTTQAWENCFQKIEAWQDAFPASVTPNILWAVAMTRYAWDARGSGYADTVTPEGWELFKERLTEARDELEQIEGRRSECPHWYAAMQTIALGQQWNRRDYERLFEEAVAREPAYYSFYDRKAFYLLPRWFGRPGEWHTFAKSLSQRLPDGLGDEFYARIIISCGRLEHKKFKDSGLNWQPIRDAFEVTRVKYPDSTWWLNQYARHAVWAGDRDTTINLFAEIGDRFDMSIWNTWEFIEASRHGAMHRKPPPERASDQKKPLEN
jgi:hypothetical protein